MQVAVLKGGYSFFAFGKGEDRDGLLTWLQIFLLVTLAGLQHNKLNKVSFQHGMLHGTNSYGDFVSVHLNHGNVLLTSGIRGIGNKLYLMLAELSERSIGDGDLTAFLAFVKFIANLLKPG